MNFNEFKQSVQRKQELENFLNLSIPALYRRYGKVCLNADFNSVINLESEHKSVCEQVERFKTELVNEFGPLNPQDPDIKWIFRKPERQWYEFSVFDVIKHLDTYLAQNNCKKSYDIYSIEQDGTSYMSMNITSYLRIDVNFKNDYIENTITFLIANQDFHNLREFPDVSYKKVGSVIKYFTDRLIPEDDLYFDTNLSTNEFSPLCFEYPALPKIFIEGNSLPKGNSLFYRGIRGIPWQIMHDNILGLIDRKIEQNQEILNELRKTKSKINPLVKEQEKKILEIAARKSELFPNEFQPKKEHFAPEMVIS